MKVAVGVVTYNAMSNMRMDLLEQTLKSLADAFPVNTPLVLLDNGHDGTVGMLPDWAKSSWIVRHRRATEENRTPGAGRNALVRHMLALPMEFDLLVISDDDMEWSVHARVRLEAFWNYPPPDELMILGGLLEDDYPWNTPRETIHCGGVPALLRDSVPGAAWTFTPARWKLIGPVAERWGYDYLRSTELRGLEYKVAQMDLAKHIGWDASTHGNTSQHRGRPLDREKWGV